MREQKLRLGLRHFPVTSAHSRAMEAACAAEAAAAQGRFWEMVDSLFMDQGRLEDPHLWERARALGMDVERFDSDRRSVEVTERVRRDFRSAIRAGVATTPSFLTHGTLSQGVPDPALVAEWVSLGDG